MSKQFPDDYETPTTTPNGGSISKMIDEIEQIFFNSPMNSDPWGREGCLTFCASWEGDGISEFRSYTFHDNRIHGFKIPDFQLQITFEGEYKGWVPSIEYERKIYEVLNRYTDE